MSILCVDVAKRHGGDTVDQWADEGMPVETMGKPRDMAEFRERQEDRPPEVPTYIEQENEASLHRSRKAQHDTAPSGEAGVPGSVRDVISSPGTDLPGDVKSGLEDRLGTSLDHVQVHTGPKAQQACEEVNARAFTVGNHIAFGPGEYDPGSPEGQHIIAHEVVHTLQQPDAAMSMMPKVEVAMEIDPDPQAEREADEVAERVLKGDEIGLDSMWYTDVHVQRAADDWNHGPSVAEQLYEDDEVDLEELGIDPDEFDIDEESLTERVVDGLKEGGLRSVLAGAIVGSAAIATGGAPVIAGGAAAASALATTTAANAAFGEGEGVSEQVVAEMSGAVAQSEAFAEQAANNEQLAENLASNETLLSKLASKLDALTGGGDTGHH